MKKRLTFKEYLEYLRGHKLTAAFGIEKFCEQGQRLEVYHKFETPHATLVEEDIYGVIAGDGLFESFTAKFIFDESGMLAEVSETKIEYNIDMADYEWPDMNDAFRLMRPELLKKYFGVEEFDEIEDFSEEMANGCFVTFYYENFEDSEKDTKIDFEIYINNESIDDSEFSDKVVAMIKTKIEDQMEEDVKINLEAQYYGFNNINYVTGDYIILKESKNEITDIEGCRLNRYKLVFELIEDQNIETN